ncbi:MAG: dihydrodipicolinate reductase [Deltaproteobacteria bacterium]|nr:MAG: dihydrodipicolinate reductase [Deltaproteobacteria bacterium]
MDEKIRVVQYGLGPIGCKSIEFLTERNHIDIVGAIDSDPKKVGVDIGDLATLPEPLGLRVEDNSKEALREINADIVVLTTTSSLEQICPQILDIVSTGKNIVSTCEELMYPWLTNPEIAGMLDAAAREYNVSVLSTGVNPGFLMDFLPLVMTGVCRNVNQVTVERIQNAQFRRLPFQTKIGVGLTVPQFEEKATQGSLRHVGLTESMHLIASGLGWRLEETTDIVNPVIASQPMVASSFTVKSGEVLGVNQIGRGYVNGEEVITLVFKAALGEPDPRDRILINGVPDIDMVIPGGINGDMATCAIIVNAIPVVIQSPPGLRTMADISPISFSKRL